MSMQIEYRDHGRKQLERALAVLAGLEIRVGVQGRTGYRAVQKRVMRATGGTSSGRHRSGRQRPTGRQRPAKPRTYPLKGRPIGRSVIETDEALRVVDLATIHEFGSPKVRIPARSYLRSTFRKHREQIAGLRREVAEQALRGENPLPLAIRLGLRCEAAVKKTLTDLRRPALRPATKHRRWLMTGDRNPNPLVDTGQVRASISNVVMFHGRQVGGIGQ